MKNLIMTITAIAALTAHVSAQTTRCEIMANVVERDPNGTNVRAGAGTGFSIIGNLPADRTDTVTIIASQGSWVKIDRADDEDGDSIFGKEGWVFAELLGMTISWNPDDQLKKGSYSLYTEPTKKSRVVSRLPSESPVTLIGCDGKWAKVKYRSKIGWIAPEAQCTNTRTNCS